ncbi:MAG: outer membrane lipoprotein carrier protein LolA [Kordiimonadaceae bacterium]|nr:outer membrane lipoprotein carrier protein LolA [Kordiimonadaceae bacterium]
MRYIVMAALMAFGPLPSLAQDEKQADQTHAGTELPALEEQVIEENVALKSLAKIQGYMENVRSLKADFLQRAPNGNVAKGTLYMERPGKIRFDYAGDIPFLVVADGKTLNFIDYEIGQITKWPVKDTPLRALLGNSTDLLSINAHIETEPSGLKGLIALSAADPDKPELGQITAYFQEAPDQAGGLVLLSWVVIDAQGEATTVEVSNTVTNTKLDSKLWAFKDPRAIANTRRTRR